MSEAFNLKQDNLLLQLKNMPRPPISKELAKEIGFDQNKYEKVIEKLLTQISEVRRERMRENSIFEEKIKSMQIGGQNKNKKIVIKNNVKRNSKNLKININRPKSNYKSVRSSGYGMAPKKIDIFSTRNKKIINPNNNNNNQNNKLNTNINKKIKLIPKSKTNNIINKQKKNVNNNIKENNIILPINKNLNINNKNNINNNNKDVSKKSPINLNEIKNELDKINNENKQLEEQYSQLKKEINNNIQKNIKKNEYKNNYELIKINSEGISKSIIDDLLYELIDDLNNIETKQSKMEKINNKNNVNKNKKIIHKKLKAKPSNNLIEKCTIYKQKFLEHMKLKGSFITKDIFKIYDNFVEELSGEILEEGLNYCIEQMNNFINKIESQK